MVSSGSLFSETLQEITNTKLEELSKRRHAFEQDKSTLLSSFQSESDPIKRLLILAAGVKRCLSVPSSKDGKVLVGHGKTRGLEVQLAHLDSFLALAKYDPSISPELLKSWEQSVLSHLETQSHKFQYADLYAKLVTEWLSSSSGDESTSAENEGFEDLGNTQRLEARMEWERVVFESVEVDTQVLGTYLEKLFGVGAASKKTALTGKQLEELRESVAAFETQLSQPNQFNLSTLSWIIQGLMASDLLSDDKREVLGDFRANTVILSEIADVLNMRLSALDMWSWGSGGVAVEQRRQISGIYGIHMHEDLLQAIFLQYIGVKWSVFFKSAFRTFRRSKLAWTPLRQEPSLADQKQLGFFVGKLSHRQCLQSERTRIWAQDYFVSQLLDNETQLVETAEGEEVADYAAMGYSGGRGGRMKQTARKSNIPFAQAPPFPVAMARPARTAARYFQAEYDEAANDENDDDDDDVDSTEDTDAQVAGPKNAMQIKQRLLHLLATEIAVNTRLQGEITAFHSTFKSWNSMLPHDTVKTVLTFFGVSKTWLSFFMRFLEAPLKFVDEKASVARLRRRGTPASHVLSDVFGETTLFCLDFAINQATTGRLLHRLYDDFWFWSAEHNVSVRAWQSIQEFAKVTQTVIDDAKSGSVRVARDVNFSLALDSSLPHGDIRWGFLRLSPQSGRFEIDRSLVDSHIEELRKQLRDHRNRSIFAFVRAWNTYASTFFTSNFGKPAYCFGRDHVDQMLATHEHIQREIFSTAGGSLAMSVVHFLKKTISQRFGISDIPDGYLFFPTELGGLDLQSPFIRLLPLRDSILDSDDKLFNYLDESEHEAYNRAKTAFYKGDAQPKRLRSDYGDWTPGQQSERDSFFSFAEFVRYRAEFDFQHKTQVHDIFRRLMQLPQEESIEPDNGGVSAAVATLSGQSSLRGITGSWSTMENYWKWVATLYGPEVIERFGGLNIVDPGLLPMGMVALFREKRVKWQG